MVLVKFLNRCRPVSLSPGSREKDLLENIRTVYGDVLSKGQKFLLQIKDDAWGGEFVDVGEDMEIADRSVFKLLLKEEVCSISL